MADGAAASLRVSNKSATEYTVAPTLTAAFGIAKPDGIGVTHGCSAHGLELAGDEGIGNDNEARATAYSGRATP
jgi:hypothetical protein